MSKKVVVKPKCGGEWTQARFNSFVKSALRQATRRWAPIQQAKKDAWVYRGFYKCASCEETVPLTLKDGVKRHKNVIVDHINPIIDPAIGFTTWDECIERMFSEKDNLQVLCKACHDVKSNEEKQIAKTRRANEKT